MSTSAFRPTHAEVNLAALRANLATIASLAAPARVVAVVKADAYGHGLEAVASALEAEGVAGFGVALAEEGLELRRLGIRAPILVLNGVCGRHHREVLEARLVPVVYDLDQIEAFESAARDSCVEVHLKIDTGMSRLGVPWREVESFLNALSRHRRCIISGLMTHLAAADSDFELTRIQLARFQRVLAHLKAMGHRPRLIHVANTAGTLLHPHLRFNWVRVGGGLYGVVPPGWESHFLPTMRIRSEVIAIRELRAGDTVGYDATYRCTRPSRIATVPMGYGDGLPRSLSNRGRVLIRAHRCPIVGLVSMDLVMVDVTEVPKVRVGDEVVFLGEQHHDHRREAIGLSEIAAWAGTIPYDLLTGISRRVPRVYVNQSC
ncbi:MAG: alanine racemase [Sandaracinaceae bacterium]|nr:alanine racemase [Sandaracinaceae bacterium]